MIHKFRDMPANLNLRKNIYVLIDEAHRTTGGDLGNFLMAGLPPIAGTPQVAARTTADRLSGPTWCIGSNPTSPEWLIPDQAEVIEVIETR
jgi:hypothetical protein